MSNPASLTWPPGSTKPPIRSINFRFALRLRCRGVRNWRPALRWVDTLHTNNGPTPGTVPAYFELDTHLAWRASDRLEFSLAGQNLLHNHHPEYGFPDSARPEIERSVYGKFAWRY